MSMLLSMSLVSAPLTPAMIAAAERRLGWRLPAAYQRFLLRYNGGRPKPCLFPIQWADPELQDQYPGGMVDVFLCLCDGQQTDLFHRLEVYRERIPADLMPIADDPGGSLILLGVRGEQREKVWFWSHDYEVDEGETPDYRNVGFVAPDLDAFLTLLHP